MVISPAQARRASLVTLADAVLEVSDLPAARELARRAQVLDWAMAARELEPQEYERILDRIENILNNTKGN